MFLQNFEIKYLFPVGSLERHLKIATITVYWWLISKSMYDIYSAVAVTGNLVLVDAMG